MVYVNNQGTIDGLHVDNNLSYNNIGDYWSAHGGPYYNEVYRTGNTISNYTSMSFS